jgi:hypothetical protein
LAGNKLNIEEIAEAAESDNQPEVAPVVEAAETVKEKDAEKKESIPALKKSSWSEVVDRISYQGIVKNMPYLMFLTVLCILYITNNNRAISLTRNINDKTKELKELRWKYMDLQSRLMYETSETQMINKTAPLGLKPLEKPAFEIKVKVPAKAAE